VQVRTVTTTDYSLLSHVRGTISASSDLLCCVAFVQSRGVHLIEKELDAARSSGARMRLLVTTAFQSNVIKEPTSRSLQRLRFGLANGKEID
jgi:HKD family nuclease